MNKCYTKIDTMNKNCQIYKIKPLECELCKTPFPDLITKNEKTFIVNTFKPEYENYMIGMHYSDWLTHSIKEKLEIIKCISSIGKDVASIVRM